MLALNRFSLPTRMETGVEQATPSSSEPRPKPLNQEKTLTSPETKRKYGSITLPRITIAVK